MIIIRKSGDRGHFNHGWLDTYHSFSFSDYYDPENMGYKTLRVINEDRVNPSEGFGTHGHKDMEIITYIIDGELEHKDSMGTGSVIRPGDVQRMSAGTGVRHSEFNASKTKPVHLLQIWILPEKTGIPPSYEQKTFQLFERHNQLRLVASHDGRNGSVTVHQDVNLFCSHLDAGKELRFQMLPGRAAWVQIAKGSLDLNGRTLEAGDGAAIENEGNITIKSNDASEFLLFDLA
jgi:quercetin 2,3-dioxygenase